MAQLADRENSLSLSPQQANICSPQPTGSTVDLLPTQTQMSVSEHLLALRRKSKLVQIPNNSGHSEPELEPGACSQGKKMMLRELWNPSPPPGSFFVSEEDLIPCLL